jgi:hypothetical protein
MRTIVTEALQQQYLQTKLILWIHYVVPTRKQHYKKHALANISIQASARTAVLEKQAVKVCWAISTLHKPMQPY